MAARRGVSVDVPRGRLGLRIDVPRGGLDSRRR